MQKKTYKPHPGAQTDFLKETAFWTFYGGARGGGKSLGIAWKMAFEPIKWHYEYNGRRVTKTDYNALKSKGKKGLSIKVDQYLVDYESYRGLIIRRTFPQLQRNLVPECDKLYKPYGAKWNTRNSCYEFPSGAKIYLVHCQDRKALDNYIGGNYHRMSIDEVNQFPWNWVDQLSTSVRVADTQLINPQILLTSNPGNVGHKWLKEKFVNKCKPIKNGPPIYSEEFDVWYQPKRSGPTYVDEEGIEWKYIPATVFDNPSILENDPGYVRRLKNLNPTLRAMWLEGDWDVFAGMFFDMWDESKHVVPQEDFRLDLNKYNVYRFYDYGTKNPFVCLFAAVDHEYNIIIFDEIVKTGLSASQQAEYVMSYSLEKHKLRPSDFEDDIADPAYWTKHSEKDGRLYSPADFYADAGIFLHPGNNDRKAGAKLVYDFMKTKVLKDNPESPEDEYEYIIPKIRFTDNCEYCIETFPNLPSAENDPEDVDTDAEDHAYDAARYGCTQVLEPYYQNQKKKKGWREELKNGINYDDENYIPGRKSWMGV